MTTLNYDANGFIVGMNRMKDGIDNVHDDTQEIIQILKSQNQISNTRMRELTRAVKSANYRSESQASANTSRNRSRSLDRQPRISSSTNTNSAADRSTNRANRSTVSRSSSGSDDRRTNPNGSPDSTVSSDNPSSSARRERDANGRFISDGSDSKRGFGLPGGFGNMGRSDISGVDPLVDSLREARDLLSPIGRAGKLAGRATKFSWSKFKALKRREPLSNDETRHNRENEKLLDKIWKAIKRQGGRAGNGLLGSSKGLLAGLLGGAAAVSGLLKKISKAKFLGPLAAIAGVGSLAMDWGNLDHKGKSEGVGGLAGAGAGGLAGMKLGAMAGAIGGPIGIAIGGTVGAVAGAWFGSEGGEALGIAASPYIQEWTDSLQRYNLAEKMDAFWKGGMTPVFSSFHSLGKDTRSWFAKQFDGLFGAGGGADGITSGNAGANGASAAKLSKKQEDNQMMVYQSFRNAGLSDAQSRAMTAEVGRENSYQDKYLFGGHNDPANNEYNLGMFSWQKERGKKLYKHLDKKGFIKNGKIVQSQEALDEQARFSVNEINTDPSYKRTKEQFLKNPNVDYNKANEVLGNNYIRWRYTDPKYAKHHQYRDQYKALIDKQLKPIEDTNVIDETKDKVAKVAKESVTAPTPSNKKGDKVAKTPSAKSGSGILGVSVNDINKVTAPKITSSSSGTPLKSGLGYEPANLPASPVLKIPAAPKIKERLDSGSSNKPIMLQSSNDTINQNLSDRGLAHAVTGGFGQDRMWG